MSDSGNLFYMAYQMLHQKLLYTNLFYTDLPFLPIMSVLYFLLTGGNFLVFNFTIALEASAIAVIIYYLLYKETQNLALSLISTTLFLFSAIILLISNSQTFILTATLFSLIAYIFVQNKKFVLAGIFLGLTFLTKAYFLPIVFAFLVSNYQKQGKKGTLQLALSFMATVLLVLMPFVLLSGNAMWADIVGFSLLKERLYGLGYLIKFFISHEPLFVLLLLLSLFGIKKDPFIGLVSIGFMLLFTFYQGMQPLYLTMIIPFLCLYTSTVLSNIKNWSGYKQIKELLISIILIYVGYTFLRYGIVEPNQGKVSDINSLVETVSNEKPNYIYGTNGLTPFVAYITKIPLLNDQINTDDALYYKGTLNSHTFTEDAIKNKALFIALGYEDVNGGAIITNQIFDLDLIKPPKCSYLKKYAIEGQIMLNRLFLFKCF